MKTKFNRKDEGEMGIGAMIMFIALVLVAAIAAGLIVDSANLIQQSAQSSGITSTADAAAGLQMVSITGDRSTDYATDTGIDMLYIKIGLRPGSPRMDIDTMAVEISDGTTTKILTMGDTTANATLYCANESRDPDGIWTNGTGNAHLMSEGSIINIDIYAAAVGLAITSYTDVTIRLLTKDGASTYETFKMPLCTADTRLHQLV